MLVWKGGVGQCPDLLWLFPASCLGSEVSAHVPLHRVTQPFTKPLGQGWTKMQTYWDLGGPWTVPLPYHSHRKKRAILPTDSPTLREPESLWGDGTQTQSFE